MDEEVFKNSIPGTAPPIFRGVVKRKYIQQHWQDKKDFYYMDTGYFGNFISPGNPGGKKLFDPRYQWKGWKKKGNKILIIVPNRKSCVFYGYEEGKAEDRDESKPTWLMNSIETIKKHTDMEIVIREKGSRSARQHHSIFDALDEDIFATVTFNSIAALESVIYGIPSFITVPCAASPLALTDLSQISKPFYPDESIVQQHCASLAYGQFTPEEISNGTAWKILNK